MNGTKREAKRSFFNLKSNTFPATLVQIMMCTMRKVKVQLSQHLIAFVTQEIPQCQTLMNTIAEAGYWLRNEAFHKPWKSH